MWLPLVLLVTGCFGESPQLVIENGTELDVTVLNGQELAVVSAGGGLEVDAIQTGRTPRARADVPSRSNATEVTRCRD
jgi:hypothetical protein